jgi:hypothetical protein
MESGRVEKAERAFDLAAMQRLIVEGPVPGCIAVGDWLATLPAEFRDFAQCACGEAAVRHRAELLTPDRFDRIVVEIRNVALDLIRGDAERIARVNREVAEFERGPPPVDLRDLDAVTDQLHHYLEGGADHLATPLLRMAIRYHGGRLSQ